MALGSLSVALTGNPLADAVKGPPVAPRVLPRGVITGITARSWEMGGPSGSFANLIDSMVLDPDWSYMQDRRGELRPAFVSELKAQLDYCLNKTGTTGHPIKAALRPRLGIKAPAFVFDAVGRMPWFTRFGSDIDPNRPDPLADGYFAVPQGCPPWWKPLYATLVRELYTLLMAAVGNHPALVEVDMGGLPGTIFPEPCIRQAGTASNLNTLADWGYTEALDDAAWESSFAIHRDVVAPLGLGGLVAYNPPGTIDLAATKRFRNGNVTRAIRLIERQMASMGGLAVLSNKSLNNLERNAGDQAVLWDREQAARAATPPTIIRYQTETYAKLKAKYDQGGSVLDTIDLALAMGATSVEVPVGCEKPSPTTPRMYLSPSAAADYNARFLAASAGLSA